MIQIFIIMKKVTLITTLSIVFLMSSCKKDSEKVQDIEPEKQEVKVDESMLAKPYHPEDDAKAEIDHMVIEADAENKNIILQIGGNWCIWCLRFNDFIEKNPDLKKLVDDNYLYYHLNYSKENKNEDLMKLYGNPGEKYGFPVFVVLNKDGYQIHTQGSEEFEYKGEEKGVYYDMEKVKAFFNKWKVQK